MPISPHLARLRKAVGHDRLLIPAVTAVIRDGAGGVLFVRSAEEGIWGLPSGAIEMGESPREAVQREVFEETGARVRDLWLMDVVGGPEFRWQYPNGDRVEYVIALFECELESTPSGPIDGEIAEVRFFCEVDAPPLPLPYEPSLLWPDTVEPPHRPQ